MGDAETRIGACNRAFNLMMNVKIKEKKLILLLGLKEVSFSLIGWILFLSTFSVWLFLQGYDEYSFPSSTGVVGTQQNPRIHRISLKFDPWKFGEGFSQQKHKDG